MNPKAFVSHASEDKERFVLGFATKLRERGIDAWLDKWEMYPGDSLVDKIFEEGLKEADAIIVVLSRNSVDKPWVREELNAGVVKRINKGSLLIPVVIDGCETPEALRGIIWETIADTSSYDASLDRIVNAIYGHREKPPIGPVPPYLQTAIDTIPGLTKVDSLVLKTACEMAIEIGHTYVDTNSLWEQLVALGISQTEFQESLDVLDRRGYVKATRVMSSDIPGFSILPNALDKYARTYLPDYNKLVRDVGLQIVSVQQTHSAAIAQTLNQPEVLIEHIVKEMAKRRLFRTTEDSSGIHIYDTSPDLRRRLSSS